MKNKNAILIVEDEQINRRILRRLLEDSYTIYEAEDGASAWTFICERRNEIFAVLLDLVMPVMDGFAFLQKIQEAHIVNLPILVVTGATDEETEQRALEAGAWDFITKPYNVHLLNTRLKNALARSEVFAYEKLRYLTEHDELTGLYNRGKLFAKTRRMLEEHPEESFLFIRLDIEHFALFNASFGEKAGDELLKYMAECIVTMAQGYTLSTYGRMNADVFCVCVASDHFEQLRESVLEVQRNLSRYRQDYRLKITVGVCEIDDPLLSIEDYFFRASIAAQRCKKQIDAPLAFYDAVAGKKIAAEMAITNEMQSALDAGQFLVYLQPKIHLATENACGAEALVRWLHPARGLVSPAEFVPVFEGNGFISKLDYYVCEQTCRMLRDWLQQGKTPFPISVNISRISLYNPKLSKRLTELTAQYGISTALLQLEITESAYMSNPELMEQTIESLRRAGFTLLMDDFGSGYSSLNTLKRIHVDILKVDMKFLPIQDDTERGEIILSSVIKMANWLGMSVIVEGVETQRQRNFLEGVGCDYVQGYYYAGPICRAEYEQKYLTDRPAGISDAQTPAQDEIVPQHNMTILVIIQPQADRDILRDSFQELYHLQMCDSAEEGLAYLKRNMGKVRLILVDYAMPGMSGLEFLRYCRQDGSLNVIPKIMVTKRGAVEEQLAAYREGAYDYVNMPFIPEILTARINHVMEVSRRSSVFDSMEQEYKKKTEIDPATKLLNKMAFRQLSTRIIESFPDDREALLILDVDDFKQINDRFGHLAGDSVLSCIAAELTNAFRKTDVLGRFGGDEFVVLMTKLPSVDIAKRKAAELIKGVLVACTKQLHISASISVGLSLSEKNDTVDTLFARADQALYEAKNSGKGRVVVYGETVPPIIDDGKPIVVICGEDPQLYPAIALAYGPGAAFANVSNYPELVRIFQTYPDRIRAVCLDAAKKIMVDSDAFYQFILEHGGGDRIPILAVYREGDMNQLRWAVELKLYDVLTFPPQIDVIQRRLSHAIIKNPV